MSSRRIALGKTGEDRACRFLREKGYSIVQTNYRTKCGEIDIIARQGPVLVFIEVKTRRSTTFGSPLLAVTAKKQRQISMVAQEYLSKNKLFESDARFDVVGMKIDMSDRVEIEHIENAFDLNYGH